MRVRFLLALLAAPLAAQDPDGPDAETEAAPPAFVVTGSVRRPDGDPAEAMVHLFDALAEDRPLGRGRTDKEGSFRVEVDRESAARREHPFGPVRVVLHEPGLARAERLLRAGATLEPVRLQKAATWEGVVRSKDGTPLPGAPVVARQGTIRLVTTTDEAGGFSFDDLGAEATAVTADAAGYRAATIERGALEFALAPLPAVRGQVVDAESLQPLAGAYVVALDADVSAETDAEGWFRMELDGGRGAVAVSLDGYAIEQHVFDGGAIGLHRAGEVAGVVVDEGDEPAAFVAVRLDPGFGPPRLARTDAAGRFSFAVGVTSFATVHARKPGYLPARATVDPGWQTDRVRVVLRRGRAVEGLVLQDGEPAPGAAVVFERRVAPHAYREVARAYADPEGRIRVLALPPAAEFAWAEADGRRSPDVAVEEKMWLRLEERPPVTGVVRDDAGRPVGGLSLSAMSRAEPSDAVAGVTDERGEFAIEAPRAEAFDLVVPGDETWLGARREAEPGRRVEMVAERRRGAHRLRVAVEGARVQPARVVLAGDGWERVRFVAPGAEAVFDALPEGTLRLRAGAPGYQDAEREVVLGAEPAETRVDVALPRAGTLRIRASENATVVVLTLEGEPAPEPTLKLATGTRVLAGFGPGRYRFLARAPGEAIVVREIEVGAKDAPRDVDLRGGPASTLRVTVTGADGKPERGVTVDLATEEGFYFRTGQKTDEEGRAELPRLILGRVRIVARKDDRRAEAPLVVEPGKTYEESILLP